jgi:hypothetical protein
MVEQETDASFGFVRVNYHYNITAAEFGLQNIPGSILYVNGSCYTEYGWFRGTINDNASTTDVYHLWNDPNYLEQPSTRDGGPPSPFFKSNRTSVPILGNSSYAIVISSLDRFSYTSGTDPCYLTIPHNTSDSPYPFIVDTGRPALSCWETNIFHYRGEVSDVWSLNELHPAFSPSPSVPSFLADVLRLPLNEPVITLIGTRPCLLILLRSRCRLRRKHLLQHPTLEPGIYLPRQRGSASRAARGSWTSRATMTTNRALRLGTLSLRA